MVSTHLYEQELWDPPGPLIRYAYVRDDLAEITAELGVQRDTWATMWVRPDLNDSGLHLLDICSALGKDAGTSGRARAANNAVPRTLAWLLHSDRTNLVIAAAEELTAKALRDLTTVLHTAGTRTWLLFEERTSNDREAALEDFYLQEEPIAAFLSERSHFPELETELPVPKEATAVPGSGFPKFLVDLRRVTTACQYEAAYSVYLEGVAAAHKLVDSQGGVTDERFHRVVAKRQDHDTDDGDTRIFSRGMEAGLFAHGYRVKLDFEHLLNNSLSKAIRLEPEDWNALDTVSSPRQAAIAALAASGLDATEIAAVRHQDISGSRIRLADSEVVLDETAVRLVGAQSIYAQLTAGQGCDNLIVGKKNAATSPRTVSRDAKATLREIGRTATIPVVDSVGSGRWSYDWGVKIEALG